MKELETQLQTKTDEVEALTEYKKRSELQQEELRLSGGYEEAC